MRTHQAHGIRCALLRSSPSFNARQVRAARRCSAAPSQPYEITARITCVDRAIIRQHFAEYRGGETDTPPRSSVRPWLVDARLPSGLHAKPLPHELELKLSALAAGFRRVRVGDDVLLIDAQTRRIVDVMRNVGCEDDARCERQWRAGKMARRGALS